VKEGEEVLLNSSKMLLTPTWPANSTDVCEGIASYDASRPPASDAFRLGNWVMFWIVVSIQLLSTCWFWFARNESRLRTVRPFSTNVLFGASQIIFDVGILLNLAIPNLPCAILLCALLWGLAGFGTHFFVRLLVYVVESQFALSADKLQVPLLDDNHSEMTLHTGTGSIGTSFSAVKSLGKLALGFCQLQDVPLQDLVIAKRSWLTIASIVIFPSVIPVFIVLIVEPQYQRCVGCAIFLEPLIIFVPTLAFYILVAARMLFVAHKQKFPDSQGIQAESYWIAFGIATPSALIWVAMVIDPNNVQYNREFMFEWGLTVMQFLFWIVCVLWQMIMIYQSRSRRLRPRYKSLQPSAAEYETEINFLLLLNEDPSLKEEFQEYTIEHYCVENLYFIDDVSMFKRFFNEKGETWQRQKAKVLFQTYIKDGGNLQVNISSATRWKVQNRLEEAMGSTSSSRGLQFVFDVAVEDIVRDVLRDVWNRFENERRKGTSTKTKRRQIATTNSKSKHDTATVGAASNLSSSTM
jgi:hypothetical protein